MATGRGLGIVTDGLVFYYDTGNSRDSYKGEPTTNLLGETGNMLPTDPSTPYDLTTSSNSVNNVNGTTWDFNRWPNTNLAVDGGIAWDPYIKGPGFTGAWRLKKRPGGNSETQFQNGLGAVSNDTDITISVWCKSSVANAARIHTNTTKAGSSYWGYASAYHSGNGTWEKLNLIIPGGSEVTSVNVIRCQVLGTTINTDVYFRHFQVEYNSHPTQFTTGTRSATQGLLDISGQGTSIDLSNVSFDSNAQMTFDGTDDYAEIAGFYVPTGSRSVELIVKTSATDNSNAQDHIFANSDQPGNGTDDAGIAIIYRNNNFYGYIWEWNNDLSPRKNFTFVTSPSTDKFYHLVLTHDGVTAKAYTNGELISSQACVGSRFPSNDTTLGKYTPGYSNAYQGDLPLVKVYSKALTASEVKRNYDALKARFGLR